MRKAIAVGLGLCLLLASLAAFADASSGLDPYEEFGKHLKAAQAVSPVSDNVFGDQVSLYNGSTEFDVTDFSIPGNNNLPVAIGRRLTIDDRRMDPGYLGGFGDWDLQVPYIEAVVTTDNGWTLNGGSTARCSDTTDTLETAVPGAVGSINAPLNVIWNGDQLHIPGMGDQELLVNNQSKSPADASAGTYKWVTTGNWKVSCLGSTANGYPGEAFEAVSPSGVTYTFNWVAVHTAPSILVETQTVSGSTVNVFADRQRVFMLATQVQDRFGNTVTYSYDSSNHLTGITSSDGRSVSLTWSGNTIASVTSALGTWQYGYGTDSLGRTVLTSVTRPDGSAWTYTITSGALETTKPKVIGGGSDPPPPPPDHCQLTPYANQGAFDYQVVAPSGAVGTFNFQYLRNYRVGVPLSCPDGNPDHAYPSVYTFFDNFSLVQKQITGPGLPTMTWTYDTGGIANDESGAAPGYVSETVPYDSSTLVYLPGGSCATPTPSYDVTVTGPTSITKYAFGKTYGCDDGRLYGTEVEDTSGNVLKTSTNTYVDETAAPNEPFASVAGEDQLANFVNPTANRNRPVTQTVISQGGATFTTAVNSFDAFARATSKTASSSLGYSKTDTTTYADDLNRWVLGLVTQTATNGIVDSKTTYDSLDQPTDQYSFGRLVSTSAWNSDGTLASITDGDNHTSTTSGWTRGLPTLITFADGTTAKATVNGAGWITAVTDQNGFTTNYAYDAMGRLSQISYPAGDDVAWNPTQLSFTQVSGSEFGIAGGHWKQVVHTGNDYAVTYFDALWRPLVTEHYDSANVNGTLSQIVDNYDAGGRKVFASYPTRSATSYTQSLSGSHMTYDALNRVTTVDQDSDIGALPTTTQYLTGFKTEVTNPNGNSATTSYQVYGAPSTQWPVSITSPGGELTTIVRDVFGKPLTITRTGTASGSPSLTQTFTYNSYQQLCGHAEPESGTTAYGYDGAGNLVWSAAGLGAGTGCYSQSEASSSGRMVTRTYDSRNRVTAITYPDGFSNASFGYAADGKLTSQSVANGGFPVTTSYSYDKRRLLTAETQSLPSTSPFALGYGYDANGHLASVVYPDGRSLAFSPNALGQPTQAGTYATNAQYFPNGAIQSYTYGSGAVYTATEDMRGLTSRTTDVLNGVAGMDFAYNYDGDGNVAAITDGTPGNVGNVDMTYDGLDRLIEADSPMFGGTGKALYTYDVFNNLVSAQLGNQSSFDYVYNANNQLAALTDPSTGADEVQYQYDAQGNLSAKNQQTYQFDVANRLEGASGLATYRYDASGRRVQKIETTAGKTLDSDYSQAGSLMYQWNPATFNATDYVYLAGTLVARVVNNQSQVVGSISGVTSGTTAVVSGWACSTGITAPISVELYVGQTPQHGGVSIAMVTANQPTGSSVASQCYTQGTAYGFSIPLSSAVRSQYPNEQIIVYGISPVGNPSVELSGSGQYTVPTNPSAPAAPASVTTPASSSTGSFTVSWTGSSGATSYVLQQFNENLPDGSWTQIYSGSATSFNVTGLGSSNFEYRVQACNSVGCSAFTTSNTVDVAIIPAAPASISVPTGSYSASIAVSWSAAAQATNYVLEERVNGGSWGVAWNGNATSTTVSVSSSGTYQFQISACAAGGCSGFTASSNVAVTLPPASAPSLSGPPSSTTGTYTLSWSTVSGATRYQLNQNLNGTVTTPYNANGTSWSSSNLGNGTYNYQVFACNVAGCGPGSNGVAVAVLHAPAEPASVTAPSNATLSTAFIVSWSAASGATSYTLQQTDTNNGNVTTKYTGSGTSASVTVGLPGYYQYAVKACNATGCSGWRNAVNMTDVQRSGGTQAVQAMPASGSSS